MNILNFKGFQVSSLQEVIDKQEEVLFAFEPALKERQENFDIDIYEDQLLLKDFLLTRVVEELVEALEAFQKEHFDHYLEELVDAFNFLIEVHIISGLKFDLGSWSLVPTGRWIGEDNSLDLSVIKVETVKIGLMSIIEQIGLTTNTLKIRPWRQSQYPVDMKTFNDRWNHIFRAFFLWLGKQNILQKEFLDVWSRKYEVNKFRIESNY